MRGDSAQKRLAGQSARSCQPTIDVARARDRVDTSQVPPINEKLPADIRVFEVVRVTKSFNAKSAAWGRRYEYLMPSYAFDGSWGAQNALAWDVLD